MLLLSLSYVDLKIRILPNEMVLGFLVCGVIFHLTTLFRFLPPEQAILGACAGFVLLYLIRTLANRYYGQDALGLGDVKLITAGGFWLGIEGIFLALTLGATAGLLHGIAGAFVKSKRVKQPLALKGLEVPAGPGFAAGIVVTGLWQFRDFF